MRKSAFSLLLGSLFVLGCSADSGGGGSKQPSSGAGGTAPQGGSGGGTTTGGGTSTTTGGVGSPGNGGTANGGTTPGAGGTNGGSGPVGTGGTAAGTPNNGGTPPVGGGGGTPSAGGGGGGNEGPITGYFTSGAWKGFAWTDVYGTAMITPANFEGVADWPICAKGTVPLHLEGGNGAMVGWNVNQDVAQDAPLGTVMPTLEGITVSVTANTPAQLRLQIQGIDGEDNADHRWCAEIGTGGKDIFVPYSSFNTECWPGGEGTFYDGTVPIAQTIVMVPSAAEAAVDFDFCIDSIAETDATGMPGGAGCDLNAGVNGSALTGTLGSDNKFQRVATNTGQPAIYVQNNIFGQGGQYDIAYNGSSFTISNFTGSAPTTQGAPMGYPSLFIGSAGGDGHATAGSGLAKQVSALTDIPTAFRWSGTGTEFNVAYDVWFAPTAGDGGVDSRSFLMVWFHKTANIYAEGEAEGQSGGIATINGKSFNTYVSLQFENRPIISYVPTSSINEWSFDLNDFITDAKTRSSTAQGPVITDSLYLTNVFAGFEVWSGVSNLKADQFCIQVK